MKKNIIAHAHIFKNAGTTIDWVLKRNFSNSFQDNREDGKMRSDPNYLTSLLLSNPGLRAIASHALPLPIQEHRELDILPIVMLRHPLLRVRSVYEFERQQKASTPGAVNAKLKSFPEYVQWRMQEDVAPTIRNMHVRYLTFNSQPRTENMLEGHYESAYKFISENMMVGSVEQFDESVVIFEQHLRNLGIDVDFAYKKQNVLSKTKDSSEERIELLRNDLGGELFDLLEAKNEFDSRLYKSATAIVTERFQAITNYEEQLLSLRNRCQALN